MYSGFNFLSSNNILRDLHRNYLASTEIDFLFSTYFVLFESELIFSLCYTFSKHSSAFLIYGNPTMGVYSIYSIWEKL